MNINRSLRILLARDSAGGERAGVRRGGGLGPTGPDTRRVLLRLFDGLFVRGTDNGVVSFNQLMNIMKCRRRAPMGGTRDVRRALQQAGLPCVRLLD